MRSTLWILLLAVTGTALAQTNKGGIAGTVLDSQGAAVAGATVVVTNLGTNEAIKLTSSETGSFSAPLLDPVQYSVTVEAAGFKKAVIEQIKVDTATIASVNVKLEPGQVKTEVTVSATADVINTESGTLGQTITERQISEMPLNNRSVLDLVLTAGNVTGVAGTEDPELSQGEIPAPGFNVNINGGRAGSTSILADGANNTGVGLARAVVTFSPDTVQEFTVQTSSFSAEFGQSGGGIVNMTTKSGTNRFDGLLYWYHRNPSLNAAPYTIATVNRPTSGRRQHQFGFTLGGPVVLPKIYDGHNKTFFFVAIEPRIYYDDSPFTQLLPTPAMLKGDFSNVVAVNGGYAPRDVAERFGLQSQIRDATVYNQWNVNGNIFTRQTLTTGQTYTPFPGNIIPTTMLDSTSVGLIKYLPTARDYYLADGNLANYSSKNFIRNYEKRLTVKVDHQVTQANKLTGRYTQVPIRGDRGRADFEVGRDEINANGTDYSWSRQALLTDTHMIGARMFNELRLNYTFGRFTRNFPPGFDASTGRNFSRELGLPSLTQGGLPEFATGVGSIGFSQSQQNENAEHSYGITDNVSWVHGRMTTKFGVDLQQQRLKTIPMFGASGRYEFNRNRTLSNNNGQANGTGGMEFAQFLLGAYNQATLREVFIPYYYQWNSAAGYVQNDWKVRPNLTVNIGMRYSLQLPRTEKYDRQGVYLPDLAQEVAIPQPCPQCTLPTGLTVTKALVIPFGYSGRGGRSRYLFPVEKTNFEPRVGFAYSPKFWGLDRRHMVLRGGWGLSHASLTGMNRNPSPDFASGTTAFGTFDNRVQFPGTNVAARLCCNKPVINPVAPEVFLNVPQDGLVYGGSINIPGFAVSSNTHIPYVESWNVTLAFEAPQQTVIELGYTGAKGTHLFLPPVNINPIPFDVTEGYIGLGINPLSNPVADPLGRRNVTNTAVVQYAPGYLATKYMGFANVFQMYDSSANSIRHAATVYVRRRPIGGLSYTANYTFGKSIDEASDAGDVRFVNLNVRSPGHVNFGAKRSDDRSVSTYDIKHAFNVSALYDLPFGKRRKFLSGAGRWTDAVIGGWTMSGVTRIQGGVPMVAVLRDDNGLGQSGNVRAIRPDIVPGVPLLNPNWSRTCPIGQGCEPYYNPSAFMRPVKGELGNAPRTLDGARSPTQHFLDLSLQKNFVLGKEGRRLQFRVDAINALNHPVFRTGRLEDAGEIFTAPSEANISNAEYDAWAAYAPATRPARATPAGAAALAQSNAILAANRVSTTNTLRPDFFHVQLPAQFFSTNINAFDITTPEGLKFYRMRQSYTSDRWGFLDVTAGRSGYTPRFVQIAVKLYF